MRTLKKDRFSYSFGVDTGEPFYVGLGKVFSVETSDCFPDKIQTPDDIARREVFEFIMSHRNPVTGPIFVEGAELAT